MGTFCVFWDLQIFNERFAKQKWDFSKRHLKTCFKAQHEVDKANFVAVKAESKLLGKKLR